MIMVRKPQIRRSRRRMMMNWRVGGSRLLKVHQSSKSQKNKIYKRMTRKRSATKEIPLTLHRLLDNGANMNGLRRQRLMRNEYFLSILFIMQGRKGNGVSVFVSVDDFEEALIPQVRKFGVEIVQTWAAVEENQIRMNLEGDGVAHHSKKN